MTAPPETIRPTQQEAAINVAGNVEGSIVKGDGNLVVHTNYGTILNESVTATRVRVPAAPGPLPPDPFVARSEELAQLAAIIAKRSRVTVSGERGAGRTALMRAAALASASTLPDGVIRVDAVDVDGHVLAIDEIAQRIHNLVWDCSPKVKVDVDEARAQLGQVQALGMIDDVALSGREFERLADLLPSGAMMISTPRAPIDSELDDIVLGPLQRADAITLLAARAGSSLQAAEGSHDDLDAICQLLADWPEAIMVAGRAIKRRALAWSAARDELQASTTRSSAAGGAAIERAYALAYPALDENARRVLMIAAVLPSRTHDPEILRQVLGAPAWFDAAVEELKALDLLTLNSPRLRIPDGVRWAIRDSAGSEAKSADDRHLEVMATEAARRRLDPEFVATELAGLLGAFDHAIRVGQYPTAVDLGRAIAPGLVLAGLWDAWRSVAERVRAAAEEITRTGVVRTSDVAWAAHELGTRALSLGSRADAESLLVEALDLRRGLGDVKAAAFTLHNLRWLGIVGPRPAQSRTAVATATMLAFGLCGAGLGLEDGC